MLIDENYEMKEKYFNQAQNKTGLVSSMVKILNDYVKEYDSAKKNFVDGNAKNKATYVFNSDEYNQNEMKIWETFNETVASLKEDCLKKVHDTVQVVKDMIADIISAKIPDGAMNDITLIQNLAGNLSDDEIKLFLKKYDKCYLVSKAIFCAMAKGQKERIGVKFISADDILHTIDDMEFTATDMIRNYNGAMTYKIAVTLNGELFHAENESFESFVSAYKE